MTEKKDFVKRTVKQAVQKMLLNEAKRWPPDCSGYFYQPRRPDTPLAQPQRDKEEK